MLSLLSLGLVDFLYVNPYMATCKAELYLTLRRNYVLSRSPGYEYLDDSYLEHIPSEDELLISKALYDDSEGPYTQTSYLHLTSIRFSFFCTAAIFCCKITGQPGS